MNLYPKIKNCPFCDGWGKLEPKSKTYIKGKLTYVTYVRCVRCHARGKRVELREDIPLARTYAINNWNRRV